MARCKLSAIFSDIAGSIGSLTIQRNRSGIILRGKPSKPGTPTNDRQQNKSYMNLLASTWNEKTPQVQMLWNDYSKFIEARQRNNQSLFLSGRALYISLNYYRLAYGQALLNNPVWTDAIPAEISFTLSRSLTGLTLTASRDTSFTDEILILFCTDEISPTKYNFTNKLRLMIYTQLTPKIWDFESQFLTKFGHNSALNKTYGWKAAIANLETGLIRSFHAELTTLI